MKCDKCGVRVMPDDKFCGACGAQLTNTKSGTDAARMESAAATQASLNTAYLHYRLGLVYYKQGKLEQAIASWEHTLEVEPAHKDALDMLQRAALELQLAQV